MKKDRGIIPDKFFELVKYTEEHFSFLKPLILALTTGRETKVKFECQELLKRINGQKIRELEEKIEELIRTSEEKERGYQTTEKELKTRLAILTQENQALKSKQKAQAQTPPNPFKYLFLWLFRKNSKFEILFLSKGKKETG